MRWLLDAHRATYGIAIMRIGFGAMTLVILALYLPHFSYTFGAGASWGEVLFRSSSAADYLWPTSVLFNRDDPDSVLLVKICLLMGVAALYMLGWRMRIISPLFVVMWLSFSSLNPVVTNTGHYQTFRMFIIFLLLADTSRRWSLDARRRRKQEGPGTQWWRAFVPQWLSVLTHNAAVVMIAYQLCVIYVASAIWKLQGNTWVAGTAVYYPLRIEELTLFPALNDLLWQMTPLVFIASWLAVYGQLLFPLMLPFRVTRIIGLIIITGMHAAIGILLALPWFSLMMIFADMIFVRDRSWRALEQRLRRRPGEGDEIARGKPARSARAQAAKARARQ